MASVAPVRPKLASVSPFGMSDDFIVVRVRITLCAISGSVSSVCSTAAAAANAGTPGVIV